jgi:hypothetical protein
LTPAQFYLDRLAADIKEGQRLAQEAANKSDDGGTCNMDGVFITIPRISESIVTMIMAAKGIHMSGRMNHSWFGRGYLLGAAWAGQGNKRATAAEVLYKHLKAKGHDVIHWQQMD